MQLEISCIFLCKKVQLACHTADDLIWVGEPKRQVLLQKKSEKLSVLTLYAEYNKNIPLTIRALYGPGGLHRAKRIAIK